MAGFTSFVPVALQALSLANTVIGGVDSYKDNSGKRAYEQEKQQSALQLAGLKQETELQKEKIRLQQEADSEDRRQKLRAALAAKRAIFGAQGIGSSGGSAQAYLLGLVNDSDGEQARDNASGSLASRILDQQYGQQKAMSTLKLTQLRERNKLKQATALYDSATDIFSA